MNKRICCCSLFVCLLLIFSVVVVVAIPTSVTIKNTEPVVRKFLVKSYGVSVVTGKSINLITGRQVVGGARYAVEVRSALFDGSASRTVRDYQVLGKELTKDDGRYVSQRHKPVFVLLKFKQRYDGDVVPQEGLDYKVEVFDENNNAVISKQGEFPSLVLNEGQYPQRSFGEFTRPPCVSALSCVETFGDEALEKNVNYPCSQNPDPRKNSVGLYDMAWWCTRSTASDIDRHFSVNFAQQWIQLTSDTQRLFPGVYKVKVTVDPNNELGGDASGDKTVMDGIRRGVFVGEASIYVQEHGLDIVGSQQLPAGVTFINPPQPVCVPVTRGCTVGVGVCARSGVETKECLNGVLASSFGVCDAPIVIPSPEICNLLDDDCDGSVDEGLSVNTYYRDADGDGFGNPAVSEQTCAVRTGFVSNSNDCNDANVAINPSVSEVCNNNVDDNCNGPVDENCVAVSAEVPPPGEAPTPPAEEQPACVPVTRGCAVGVGVCARSGVETKECVNGVLASSFGACSVSAGSPITETCNALDDDCDGGVDEALGSSTCGFAACTVTVDNCVGGQSQTCTPDLTKSSPETGDACSNTVDDDCDNLIDADDPDCALPAIAEECLAGVSGFMTKLNSCPSLSATATTVAPVLTFDRKSWQCHDGTNYTSEPGVCKSSADWSVYIRDSCSNKCRTVVKATGPVEKCGVNSVFSMGVVCATASQPTIALSPREVCVNDAETLRQTAEVACGRSVQPEVCNGEDDDGDGVVDNGLAPLRTGTDVGECQVEIKECQNGVLVTTQEAISPVTELCNEKDDNCDGEVDEFCVTADCGSADAEFNAKKLQFEPLKQPYHNNLSLIANYTARCRFLDSVSPGTVVAAGIGATANVNDVKDCWNQLSVIGRNFEPVKTQFLDLRTLFLQKQVVAYQACNRCLDKDICGNDFDDDCDGKLNYDCKTPECFLAERAFARVEAEYEQLRQQGNVILSARLEKARIERDAKLTAKNTACACASSAEVCDGRDNNCDGSVDEALAVPLTCGVGACARTVVSACVDGERQYCVPGVPAVVENCKNAVDDDCDGLADLDDGDCLQCAQKVKDRGDLKTNYDLIYVQHGEKEYELNKAKNECYSRFFDLAIVTGILDREGRTACINTAQSDFGVDVARLSNEMTALAAQISAIDNDPLLGNCPFDSLYVYDGKCLKSGCIKTTISYVADPTIGGCSAYSPDGLIGKEELLKFKVLNAPIADISVSLIGGTLVQCFLNEGTPSFYGFDANNQDSCHVEHKDVKIPKDKILVGADKFNTFRCAAGDGRGGARWAGFKLLKFQVPQ